ncbi:MAG: twin-arginine translocase TatA/TatE family subunit [Candidatus Bathyarchaeota archaeon]|nr:MAG: twin-arginine translocase TatA/TatE family subunit [Candidatus Bathyarchaeota archaeon]
MFGWQEVVLIFAILLFVFGPTKLPKIARELGKIMQEFNKAASGFREEFDKVSSDTTKTVRPSSTKLSGTLSKRTRKSKLNQDKSLSTIAEKLDISTQGKTKEQITQEVLEKIEGKKEEASIIKAEKR